MEERWQVPVVSVGEVLRKAIADGTPLGREAASFIDFGRLVPDRVAVAAVEAWLVSSGAGESFVFDGFPRTVGQAQALDEVLARLGTPLTAVVWLELDERSIAERVGRRVRALLPERVAGPVARGRLPGGGGTVDGPHGRRPRHARRADGAIPAAHCPGEGILCVARVAACRRGRTDAGGSVRAN